MLNDKVYSFFVGIILSTGIVMLGLYLTNILEDGVPLALSVPAIPIAGYFLYRSKYKYIGVGMLISAVPVTILGILFIIASSLH